MFTSDVKALVLEMLRSGLRAFIVENSHQNSSLELFLVFFGHLKAK
jgi:hypothetical protein